MRHTFLVVTVTDVYTFTEVIAKLKQGFSFLDHPVVGLYTSSQYYYFRLYRPNVMLQYTL